ncbi:MAG: hypothetical protein GYB36_04050 [Alphaproteobacteria bacterium]|nr:hypothetical protein [Alphaproteobacteria bacterium]
MKRSWYLPLMLVSALLIFLAGNHLSSHVFRSLRIDLTEDGLYQLSPGSLEVINRINEPVVWEFYHSRSLAAQYPAIRSYASRVREFLRAYEEASGGAIRLREIDPEPFSVDEDAALAAGLIPIPTETGEPIYFGLVASNAVDETAIIEQFYQENESRLEFELTQTIAEIERPRAPRLGVITSLAISPDSGAPNRFIQELMGSYALDWLERDFEALPENIDALLILHPGDLSDAQLYLIDQYVLGGGNLIAMLDPLAHMALRPGPDGLPPLDADRGSDLGGLTAAWGVVWDRETAVMDRSLGLQVQITGSDGRLTSRAYPLWFSIGPEHLSDADGATSDLARGVNFGSPGLFAILPETPFDVTPLMRTSPDGARIDADLAAASPGPDELLAGYYPAPQPLILGARLNGMALTAFPEGPPAEEALFNPADHLSTGAAPARIILIADADWLDDSYYVNRDPAFGELVVADNLALAMNLIDSAAGDEALIGLRSRAPSYRPMERVDQLRADAEARYFALQAELEAEIATNQARLDELESSGAASALYADGSGSALDEARALREQILEARARLREVEREFRRDIDALDAWLQFWTIFMPPFLVILIAMAGVFVRRRREGRS